MRWGDDERFVFLGELVPESFSNLLPAFELEAAADEATSRQSARSLQVTGNGISIGHNA